MPQGISSYNNSILAFARKCFQQNAERNDLKYPSGHLPVLFKCIDGKMKDTCQLNLCKKFSSLETVLKIRKN